MSTIRRTLSGVPAVLTIHTKFADRDTFVQRFCKMVDSDGMIVASRQPRAVGVRLSFIVTLESGAVMLEGDAEVAYVQALDKVRADRSGMRLRFLRLPPASRALIDEMVQVKRAAAEAPEAGALAAAATQMARVVAEAGESRAESESPLGGWNEPLPTMLDPGPRFVDPETASVPPLLRPSRAAPPPLPVPRAVPFETSSQRVETRAPGSSYIVAANPLAEIDDDAIRGFVDCTLFDDLSAPNAAPVETPGPEPAAPREPRRLSGATESAVPLPVAPEYTPAPTVIAPAPAPPQVIQYLQAPAPPVPDSLRPPLLLYVALTAAVCLLLGIGAGVLLRFRGSETAVAPPLPAPTQVAPIAPPPSEAPVAAPSAPEVPENPAVVDTGCSVEVRSIPPGATWLANGKPEGVTPGVLKGAPCDQEVLIVLDRPQHERYAQRITPRLGKPAVVDAELTRTEGRLAIWSQPEGALITLDGRPIGKTPRTLMVKTAAHEIRLELPGYRPWSSNIYARGKYSTISPVLEPEGK
ncbi:MAG: PEGA domain-containing protein [Myxococcales bacterium]|nr:PEGA domain-containing protein [Myxococcales bacterium]